MKIDDSDPNIIYTTSNSSTTAGLWTAINAQDVTGTFLCTAELNCPAEGVDITQAYLSKFWCQSREHNDTNLPTARDVARREGHGHRYLSVRRYISEVELRNSNLTVSLQVWR